MARGSARRGASAVGAARHAPRGGGSSTFLLGLALVGALLLIAVPLALVLFGGPDDDGVSGSTGDDGAFSGETSEAPTGRGGAPLQPSSSATRAPGTPGADSADAGVVPVVPVVPQ